MSELDEAKRIAMQSLQKLSDFFLQSKEKVLAVTTEAEFLGTMIMIQVEAEKISKYIK